MALSLDDIERPEPDGPTMADLARARQILDRHDVIWALGVVEAAMRAEQRDLARRPKPRHNTT